MKILAKAVPFLTFLTPALVLAANPNFGWLNSAGSGINNLINNYLIPIVMALILLAFFWGVLLYFIWGAGDEEKRKTGKSYMLYAIIGLVAVVAVWGIVALVIEILGVNAGQTYGIPRTPGT